MRLGGSGVRAAVVVKVTLTGTATVGDWEELGATGGVLGALGRALVPFWEHWERLPCLFESTGKCPGAL